MPLKKEDQIILWDAYRTQLVQEAQKVWEYAMTRDKWQRYFTNLAELERSNNVSSLRNQVSDDVYQSLIRAQRRYEAWGSWRWILLAFTAVGRKVSLYHYLCFDEKLRALSEKFEPDLTAITELETSLLRATERLSWGSKTRVMLQGFWNGIKEKTAEIKQKLFGIVSSFPVKKRNAKKHSESDISSITSEEQVLNDKEIQDIRERCKFAPPGEPFVPGSPQSLAIRPYRDVTSVQQIVAIEAKDVMKEHAMDYASQYRARYALLKMIIYRELDKVEQIFLDTAKKCVDTHPSHWLSMDKAAKKEAQNKLQELLNYLTPAKHIEACIHFKKEVIQELERLHIQLDGSKKSFDVEAELKLLGYEQERGINILPEFDEHTPRQLIDRYYAYLVAWDSAVGSQDISKMRAYAMTARLLQVQQNTAIGYLEQTVIYYCHLLGSRAHNRVMSCQHNQIRGLQQQLMMRQDEEIRLLSEQNAFLTQAVAQNERSLASNKEAVAKNEEALVKLQADFSELKKHFIFFQSQKNQDTTDRQKSDRIFLPT